MQYKYFFCDKNGYPVEGIIGHPIKSFIRKLLLTRKIVKGYIKVGMDLGSKDGDCTVYVLHKTNGERLLVNVT